jgi:predicted transposase YbfD/YdcC
MEAFFRSNEITAIPELMELLDLKGTIVTADVLNTQKDIAKKAIERGVIARDYLRTWSYYLKEPKKQDLRE